MSIWLSAISLTKAGSVAQAVPTTVLCRDNNNMPPADLWRRSTTRGHSGVTLRSSTTTRWWRRRLRSLYCADVPLRNWSLTHSLQQKCLNKSTGSAHWRIWFLPCSATQSAVMQQFVVCLSSVCNVQVPWPHRLEYFENNLRPNSLRLLLGLMPTWAIWCNGNTPKIMVE